MSGADAVFRVNAVRDWECNGRLVVYRPEYTYRVTDANREQVDKWVLSGVAEYLDAPVARVRAMGHVGT